MMHGKGALEGWYIRRGRRVQRRMEACELLVLGMSIRCTAIVYWLLPAGVHAWPRATAAGR